MFGFTRLAAFLWSLKSSQYDDPDGAAAPTMILLHVMLPHAESSKVTITAVGSCGSDAM